MTEEHKLQRAIMQYLDAIGVYYVRTNAGGQHGRIRLAPAGTPDIIACAGSQNTGNNMYIKWTGRKYMPVKVGEFISIEVKSMDGKQSIKQIEVERKIRGVGGIYILARKLEDVSEVIK